MCNSLETPCICNHSTERINDRYTHKNKAEHVWFEGANIIKSNIFGQGRYFHAEFTADATGFLFASTHSGVFARLGGQKPILKSLSKL